MLAAGQHSYLSFLLEGGHSPHLVLMNYLSLSLDLDVWYFDLHRPLLHNLFLHTDHSEKSAILMQTTFMSFFASDFLKNYCLAVTLDPLRDNNSFKKYDHIKGT